MNLNNSESYDTPTFTASSGIVTVNGTFVCAGIIVSVSDSASFAGTATLVNATLNLFSATGGGTFECYGVCNLSGTVGPNETVVLGTGNQYPGANVFYANGTSNGGTIDLQPDTVLIWGDGSTNALSNLPGGTIEAVAGNGDAAELIGTFYNQGDITVSEGATLNLNNSWTLAKMRAETV